MKKILKDILYKVALKKVVGSTNIYVDNLTSDSRNVGEESVFFAIQGSVNDGHNFIPKVIELGCKIIISEKDILVPAGITLVVTDNSRKSMGVVAHNFYDCPSEKLSLIGVTGTNGKTSSVTFLHDLFTLMNKKSGLISTIVNKIGSSEIPSSHTTPDSLELNRLLAKMVAQGCEYCFMEVSSHAVDQYRISGISFSGAVFTNITHDHLDYHLTFKDYLYTKKRFFDELPDKAFALVNIDDKNGSVMFQNTRAKKVSYAMKSMADYKVKVLENQLSGLMLNIGNTEFYTPLVGEFNAYNLLVAYAVSDLLLAESHEEILRVLSSVGQVSGRFEHFVSKDGIVVIIDYAHTPDALENVLQTIDVIRTHNETLFTVIGCGGDRDRSKRPEMATIACKYSDKVIFTADNPRTENPEDILNDMYKGVESHHFKKTTRITERKQAIQTAISMAKKGDIILIAGKGHEKYQEINGVKHSFDDKQVALELLNN